MVVYKLFNFGPTRIVEFQGRGFTFTHNTSWETQDENEARYITSHYPKIDLVDVKTEGEPPAKAKAKKDLSEMTMKQLREIAKEKNLRLPPRARKQDLINVLEN